MSKCERCVHKNICKHEKEMKKFEAEIVEKTKLIEYAEFTAKVECKHYCEEKTFSKQVGEQE